MFLFNLYSKQEFVRRTMSASTSNKPGLFGHIQPFHWITPNIAKAIKSKCRLMVVWSYRQHTNITRLSKSEGTQGPYYIYAGWTEVFGTLTI